MIDIREIKPEAKRKAKDRDGLYKRRDYWHYELIIDGKKRSFTSGTKDYNEAKKKRARAMRDIQEGKAQTIPAESALKLFLLNTSSIEKRQFLLVRSVSRGNALGLWQKV